LLADAVSRRAEPGASRATVSFVFARLGPGTAALCVRAMSVCKTIVLFGVVTALTGCRSPSPSRATFHRPLPEVVAAIQQTCARAEAQTNRPTPWITDTNAVPGVSYTVSILDQFTSYPIGRTEISALSTGPSETQVRVDSVEPSSVGWHRRQKIEAKTITEIDQIPTTRRSPAIHFTREG
jgi:hypothetical protein